MIRKNLYILCFLTIGVVGLTACNNSTDKSDDITTQATTQESTTTTAEATEDTGQQSTQASTSESSTTGKPLQTTKEDPGTTESDAPKVDKVTKGTGTYNGFADSHSVEVELSDGTIMTFFVFDEKIQDKLNNIEEGSTIKFTYGPLKGQINPQIISIDK